MTKNIRRWTMYCHLSAIIIMFVPGGNIIGPLIIWLIRGEKHPLIEAQAKESLNFQISMTIVSIFAYFLSFIWIGRPLILILMAIDIIMVVLAIKSIHKGLPYLYPFNFRIIK